jgi:hypothetical protein
MDEDFQDDDASAVERLRRLAEGERAGYDFRSAEEVFGAPGADLVEWWAKALAERAEIHPDHYEDAAETVVVEFSTTPQSVMHYAFYGREAWIEDWNGSFDDVREQLAEVVRDFAGQVKADRGFGGGHHPWDDPVSSA